MLLKEWIKGPLVTVDANASLGHAIGLITKNEVSILPVISEERLVGMVTDLDLKPYAHAGGSFLPGVPPALVLSRLRVSDIMWRAAVTVPHDYTVEEAADILLRNEIPGVVVVDNTNRVLGVFTQSDTNRVLVSVTGLRKGGIVLGFLIEDRPGSIKDLTDILRANGGRVASILTSYEKVPKNYRKVHIRVRGLSRPKLTSIQEELQRMGKLLYLIDFRENIRQVFDTDN